MPHGAQGMLRGLTAARVGGVEVASVATGADYGTPDGIEVGGFPFDPATSTTFAEVLLFDRALDAGEIAGLEAYLAARYGL